MNLKNSSLIVADIEIEFLEDTTVFEIDKTFTKLEVNMNSCMGLYYLYKDLFIFFIILQPGFKSKLTITAAPTEVGTHTCLLLFSVKDNPEIVTVNIGCSGVVPMVELLPLTQTIGNLISN